MSRVANNPIQIPAGVEVTLNGQLAKVKGSKGEMNHQIHAAVEVNHNDSTLTFAARDTDQSSNALAGRLKNQYEVDFL